ncbi:endonuclease/exonuclease/phosphatase family protein [Streptomyces sp. TBY4]|uniref:endonuclease/exonuclease/phosphatase family protein n=1 Tax=Streptomyces sp. TBY4 TaxID=2962030 RepID=UPI0020B6E636|nr:endonuclease/exonuclease/phosphatase family protein [Streptomyces sp. TBY4]MCP3757386.1 endonuclease/exonuclease/phosphatase family protein [Streptomyces sp. TBY4]
MYPRNNSSRPPSRFSRIPAPVVVTVLCAVIAVLLGAAGYAMTSEEDRPEPAPAAGPGHVNVLNWNICGEAGGQRGKRGFCPNRNRPDLTVREIVEMVDERNADVVTLQEVCGGATGSHLALLKSALGEGWSILRARGTRPDGASECRGSLTGELGVAIAVHGKIESSSQDNTLSDEPPESGEHVMPLLCADVEGWSHRICTTHLVPGDDPRGAEQAERISRLTSPDGKPFILTGDFNRNSKAEDLDPLTSMLSECEALTDKVGGTHHAWDAKAGKHVYRTLDHIFASPGESGEKARFSSCGVDYDRMDTTPNEREVAPNGKSDHGPLYATVEIHK